LLRSSDRAPLLEERRDPPQLTLPAKGFLE